MQSYAALQLTVSSPPQSFTEPITKAQVRTWLAIQESSPADSEQDAMLDGLISAARSVAEVTQHRDLAVKQWDMRLDGFPALEIELPRHPAQSVDLVQYTDSTGAITALVDGTDHVVDLSRDLLTPIYGGSWPSATLAPSGGILVRFTAGYPPSDPFWSNEGARLIQGMRMLIAGWHEGRLPYTEGTPEEYPYAVTALFQMDARFQIP